MQYLEEWILQQILTLQNRDPEYLGDGQFYILGLLYQLLGKYFMKRSKCWFSQQQDLTNVFYQGASVLTNQRSEILNSDQSEHIVRDKIS